MFTKLKKVFFLILIINIKIYSFEDGIIELEVNDFIRGESIPAYFDNRDYPTLELDEFFYVTGITTYEVDGNTVKFRLNGEWITSAIDITKTDNTLLFYSGDIGKLFPETELGWDPEYMILSVTTPEKLPGEFLDYQERRRGELAGRKKEEDVIEEQWKLFTPGVLNLGYGRSDASKGDDLLSLNYVNQFIYGALEINASHEDDFEVDTARWKRYTLSKRKIVLGDSFISNPTDLGDSPSFRGVSIFRKNSWDTSLDVNSKRVTGFAPNGAVAELYENGILKEYQIVRGGSYEFEIQTTGGNRNYEVWIYRQDGEIEKKPVSVYGSNDLLERGEFDYEIQGGQDRDDTDYNPYRGDILYGITEDFTLKLGGYNAREEAKEEDYFSLSPAFRIGTSIGWSHFFTGNFSQNTSTHNEKYYKGEFVSSNGTLSSTLGYERYRNFDSFFIDEDYDEKFLWKIRFPFLDINSSLSYEMEKDHYNEEKTHRYGLTMYDSFFRGKISASVSLTRENLKRETSENEDSTEVSSAVSYNISNKYLSRLIDTVGLEYDGESSEADTYGFYLQRRSRRNRRLDYYFRLRKEEGQSFGELSVTYRFGEKINIRSYNYKNKDNTTTHGFDINTAVNFGAPEDKIYYSDYMGDSNVTGTVFIDSNNNGVRDSGEQGVPSFIIKNSSREWSTDDTGEFFMPLIYSGSTHSLNIKNSNDDILNYYYKPKYSIKTLPGGSMYLDIPIVPLKSLVGIVEFDEDIYMEEIRELFQNTVLEIISLTDNSKERITITDEYFIRELPTGSYMINIIYEGNKKESITSYEFEISSDEDELEEYLDIKVVRDKENKYKFQVRN